MAGQGDDIANTHWTLFWPAAKTFKDEEGAETIVSHDASMGYGQPVPGEPSPNSNVSAIPKFLSVTPCGWYNPHMDSDLDDDLEDPSKVVYLVAVNSLSSNGMSHEVIVSEFDNVDSARASVGLLPVNSLPQDRKDEWASIDTEAWNQFCIASRGGGLAGPQGLFLSAAVKVSVPSSLPLADAINRPKTIGQTGFAFNGLLSSNGYLVSYPRENWSGPDSIAMFYPWELFVTDQHHYYSEAHIGRPHPQGIPEYLSNLMETGQIATAQSSGMLAGAIWRSRILLYFFSYTITSERWNGEEYSYTEQTMGATPVYRLAWPDYDGQVDAVDPAGLHHEIQTASRYITTGWMCRLADEQELQSFDLGLAFSGSLSFTGNFDHVVEESGDSRPGLNLETIYHYNDGTPDVQMFGNITRHESPSVPDRRYDASYLDWDPIYND